VRQKTRVYHNDADLVERTLDDGTVKNLQEADKYTISNL